MQVLQEHKISSGAYVQPGQKKNPGLVTDSPHQFFTEGKMAPHCLWPCWKRYFQERSKANPTSIKTAGGSGGDFLTPKRCWLKVWSYECFRKGKNRSGLVVGYLGSTHPL
jgi:hypothetical protein